MSRTHGWTTWDASSIAVWEHLPSGLRCQLVVEDDQGRQLNPADWEPLEEALPDDAGRSIAHTRIMVGNAEIEVECGGNGDIGACRIANILGDEITAHWEIAGSLDGWQVRRGNYDVVFAPENAALPDDTVAFLREERESVLTLAPEGEWGLQDPIDAMKTVLATNTFTLPTTGDVITVSRFDVEQGGLHIPNWETFLTALGIAYVDPNLAVANCKTALRLFAKEGILGAEFTTSGVRTDISSPPVAAFCVWKLFQITGDFSLLNEAYPLLLRWHDWWWNARDGNQNHLFNWKSADETGMPAHPIYADAPTDEQTGVLRVDDVALSSLWSLDAYALMRMALQLNDLDQATHLEKEINDTSTRMNLYLWNPDLGSFQSRDWDGYFTDRLSATVFLSLIGSIPTRGHADRLIAEHLANDFAAPFLVPTLGTRDPDFNAQLPWQGRVSPLLNYLICEGLRQFGEDDLAENVTLSGLDLVNRSWRQHHHLYGSYNALTGKGNDIAQDPHDPTGMLFSALGIGMLMDAEAWNGLRMGNLHGIDLAINGLPLHGDTFDLASGPWGFSATRNDELWLDFDRPAILRNLTQTENQIACGIKIAGGGHITVRFHGYQPNEMVSVKVNGKAQNVRVNKMGAAESQWDIEAPHGGHGIWYRAA